MEMAFTMFSHCCRCSIESRFLTSRLLLLLYVLVFNQQHVHVWTTGLPSRCALKQNGSALFWPCYQPQEPCSHDSCESHVLLGRASCHARSTDPTNSDFLAKESWSLLVIPLEVQITVCSSSSSSRCFGRFMGADVCGAGKACDEVADEH